MLSPEVYDVGLQLDGRGRLFDVWFSLTIGFAVN